MTPGESLLDSAYVVLVFVIGVVTRLVLAFLVLAAVTLPVAALLEAAPRLRALWQRLRGALTVEGLPWRRGDYYAPGHTWLRPRRGHRLAVGLDGLAARLMPWVRSIALPAPGAFVHRGDVVAELAFGGRRADILAPVDGTVVRVNDALRRDPALALRDPYGRGWLFTVAPSAAWEKGLRSGDAARDWFAQEARALTRVLEDGLGLAAADGGHMVGPAPEMLDEERWRTIARMFLHAA